MKKLLLAIAFLTLCVAASAQIIPDGTAKRSGGNIKIEKQKLNMVQRDLLLSDIDGHDYLAKWKRCNAWRKTGIWMTAGGSVVTVVGLGYTMVYALAGVIGMAFAAGTGAVVGSAGGEEAAQETASEAAQEVSDSISPYIDAGLIVTGLGAVTTIAGIPVIITNCSKMNKIVKAYNNSRPLSMDCFPELSVSPTLAYVPATGTVAPGVGIKINF
ncbi:MAG: hypothetical protein J5835_04095 [Bacteroidales bacterium]|nr:hypothetical protein [Bacteroidales bacterium]